jgi:hypothetical protein
VVARDYSQLKSNFSVNAFPLGNIAHRICCKVYRHTIKDKLRDDDRFGQVTVNEAVDLNVFISQEDVNVEAGGHS